MALEKQDLAILSLPFGIFQRDKPLSRSLDEENANRDAIVRSCQEAQQTFSIKAEVKTFEKEQYPRPGYLSVVLSGSGNQLLTAKRWLIQRHPKQEYFSVKAPAFDILDSNFEVKATVSDRVAKITTASKATVKLSLLNPSEFQKGLISVDGCGEILFEIQGAVEQVEHAKLDCLALIDEMGGWHVETIHISQKFHPVINGRKRNLIRDIMETHRTNVYFPVSVPLLEKNINSESSFNSRVIISGPDKKSVMNVKDYLEKAAAKIKLQSKTIEFDMFKFDTLMRDRKAKVLEISSNYAAFFQFIAKSPQKVEVVITGDRSGTIDRAIKALIDLTSDIMSCKMNLTLNGGNDQFNRNEVPAKFARLTAQTCSEISMIGSTLEIMGDVRALIISGRVIKDNDVLLHNLREVTFSALLSQEYKDFITGKKNGKLNKITKSCGVNIDLQDRDENTLLVLITGGSYIKTYEAFLQFKDEMPAEYEFFVSDIHHKRIIGVGGKNIQGIMKNYGVYVKFLSAEEFTPLGGLVDQDKNVLARTPAKNASNLINLYRAVLDTVDPREKSFAASVLSIPRRYHRILSCEYRRAVEDATRTTIIFPSTESGSEKILIRGLDTDIKLASDQLMKYTPQEYRFKVASCEKLDKLEGNPEYRQLVEKLIAIFDLKISHSVVENESIFYMKGNMKACEQITRAFEDLRKFLDGLQVELYDPKKYMAHGLPTAKVAELEITNEAVHDPKQSLQAQNDATPMKNTGSAPNLRMALKEPATGFSEQRTRSSQSAFLPNNRTDQSNYQNSFQRSALFNGGTMAADVPSFVPSIVDQQGPSLTINTSLENALAPGPINEAENVFDESIRNAVRSVIGLNTSPTNRLVLLMEQLELSKFSQPLLDNDVDFDMIQTLTDDDLKELGLSLGARKKLLQAATEIRSFKRTVTPQVRSAIANALLHPTFASVPASPTRWATSPGPKDINDWSRPSLNLFNIHNNRTMPVLPSITSPITPTLNLGFVDFIPSASPITSPQPQTNATTTNGKNSPVQLSKLPPALSAREMSPATTVDGHPVDNGQQRPMNSFFSFQS